MRSLGGDLHNIDISDVQQGDAATTRTCIGIDPSPHASVAADSANQTLECTHNK